MVLYFIGLGLADKEDITLKGLNALKSCEKVFLEHYTAVLFNISAEELAKFYGVKEIILADRTMVEQKSDEILNTAKDVDTAFLVVGDPFCATTHTDLLLRAARDKGIDVRTIHNASIMNAVACCGLQLYNFGQTISIPLWTERWKPMSFYSKLVVNQEAGFHTLCLLDIKVKEVSEENMMRGRDDIFDPPRYMTVQEALTQLLECEKEKKSGILTDDTIVIGMARVGHATQCIRSGPISEVLKVNFGEPMHSLVICGTMHEMEQEVLNDIYQIPKQDAGEEEEEEEVLAK